MSDKDFTIDKDRRYSNEFNLSKTLVSFINNPIFKKGFSDIESGEDQNSKKAYIWRAISAVGDDITNTIYENILNYIDNISNIDLCKTKALQSLVNMHGIKYSILNSLVFLPLEIRNLVDIYSVNKRYLAQTNYLKNEYFSEVSSYIIDTDKSSTLSALEYTLSDINEITIDNIQNRIKNDSDEKTYYNYLSTLYASRIVEAVNLKFVDSEISSVYENSYDLSIVNTPIWKIYLDEFSHKTSYEYQLSSEEFRKFKILNSIDAKFNEIEIADNIINGSDSLSNYQGAILDLINMELDFRKLPYSSNIPESKYMIQKKNKVREYFEFVEWRYKCINNISEIGGIYQIDKKYIELNTPTEDNSYNLLVRSENKKSNFEIDYSKINTVANNLAGITIYIAKIREYLKYQAQKNYMKGTYNLLTFLISIFSRQLGESNFFNMINSSLSANDNNKYIFNKVADNLKKITQDDIEIIEYIDTTEYFNISTDNSGKSKVNARYWEADSFTGCFSNEEIENFYLETLQCKDKVDSISTFLNSIYEAGASKSYIDKDNNLCVNEGANSEVSSANYEILLSYNGNKIGYSPYANHKNLVHPSYQLHPFLKSFIKYENYKNAIENAFTNSTNDKLEDEYVQAKLSDYIGDFGQSINIAMNNSFDYSGYMSQYEYSDHFHESLSSEVVDYDGAFYPSAIKDYREDTFNFINQISCGDTDTDITQTYFEKYYSYLGLSEKAYERISNQLCSYYPDIYRITNSQKHLSNVYDIFKYGIDRFENMYILYKRYSSDNPTYEEKLNTPGELWIRLKDHPIAFPAFYGSIPAVEFDEVNINGNIELLTNQNHKIDYMKYIYDFDFDEQLQTIALVVYQQNIDDKPGLSSYHDSEEIKKSYYKKYQHADIIICNIEEEYDSFVNYTKLYLKSDPQQYIGRVPNYNTVKSGLSSADSIEWKTDSEGNKYKLVPCLLGIHSNKSNLDIIYIDKKMTRISDSDVEYSLVGYDEPNLYLYRYQYQQSNNIYKGKLQYGKSNIQEFKYQDAIVTYFDLCGSEIKFSYNNEYLNIACLAKPIESITSQTYIGQGNNQGKAIIDELLENPKDSNEENHFSFLDKYIITFDIDFRINDIQNSEADFIVQQLDIYNLNADISYIPQFPGVDGKHDMSLVPEYLNNSSYSIQLLGNSKNLQGIEESINICADFDENMYKLSSNSYGRVWEDYFEQMKTDSSFKVLHYSIENQDKWIINLDDYNNKEKEQLKLILINSNTCSKNPYYVGSLSSLLSENFSCFQNKTYMNGVENSEVETNDSTVEIAGTYQIFKKETIKQNNNYLVGVKDIELAFDNTNLTINFIHDGQYLIHSNEVVAVVFNEYDLRRFQYYHLMDASGKWKVKTTNDLKNIELSNYSYLSSVPYLSGIDGLAFKYSEEDCFNPSNFLFYYPGINIKYPSREIDFIESSVSSSYIDMTNIFSDNNAYIFKLNDTGIIDRIGEIAIPTMFYDNESYKVFEEYLSTDENGDFNYLKYDENDLRILNYVHLFEDTNTDLERVQNTIDTYINEVTYLSDFINSIEIFCSVSAATVEQYQPNSNDDYYQFTPDSSCMKDIEKALNIYSSYKIEDDGSITLYFNYQNYIDTPYVKLNGSKYKFDIVDGTYLKLKSGENGILDIVIQVKRIFDNKKILGYRNIKLASFRIYNISDDNPKFLIYRLGELVNDNSYEFTSKKATVEIMPVSQTLLFEDMEQFTGGKIPITVDISIISNTNLSTLNYDIFYSFSDLEYIGSLPHVDGVISLSSISNCSLEFKTTDTYEQLTSTGTIKEYFIEAQNAIAQNKKGETIECIEDIGNITMKYSTYIRQESSNNEALISGEINEKIGNIKNINGIKIENLS